MQSSGKLVVVVSLSLLNLSLLDTVAARGARVDMSDPRRALGRQDDVRIDAQILQHELSPSSPLSVTYQIHNLTAAPVAVADKTTDIDYDVDTGTIVFSIGAEVPSGKKMPHLVVIRPGEKKAFRAGGTVRVITPNVRTPWTAVPRFVQIKVVILRDLAQFADLIDVQTRTAAQPLLPNDLFDRWVEASDSMMLNPVPVRWTTAPRGITAESQSADAGGGL
jgi:hypothetical protein